MRSPAKLLVMLAVLAMVLVACGGDDAAETTAAETEAEATTTTAAAVETTMAEDMTETTEAMDACAVENLELVTPGTLTVATGEPAFPPWVGTADDNFDVPESKTGYESAFVYELASRMGFSDDQVVWIRTTFDGAITAGPKDFDFNLQQYSITDERDQVVDFSAPYYVTQQALVTFADSPYASAASFADLNDAQLGAQLGTTSLDYIENVIQPANEPFVYDTNADAKAAMDASQLDGIVVDLPTAYYITAVEIENSTIAAVFDAPAAQPDEFGLLMADGSSLKACIDPIIEEMRTDGTLDALAEEWLTVGSGITVISG